MLKPSLSPKEWHAKRCYGPATVKSEKCWINRLWRSRKGENKVEAGTFWLHIGLFGIYNVLIGYLLLYREESRLWPLVMDGIAMALHFMIDDFDLRQDHKDRDDRTGRWPFALGGAAYAAQLVAAG